MDFTIAGTSARGSGLALIEQYLPGLGTFPAAQSAGALPDAGRHGRTAYTGPVADRSQYGRIGALVTGSAAKRTAAGMGSTGTGDTPGIRLRQRRADQRQLHDRTGHEVGAFRPAQRLSHLLGRAVADDAGALHEWHDHTGPLLEYGVQNTGASAFNISLYRSAGWEGNAVSTIKDLLFGNISTTRVAVGVSYNADTGIWTMANSGGSQVWYDKAAGDALIAMGTNHALGATRYGTGTPSGELGMAVVYGRAKTAAEMQPMLVAMRAIVAARGVTVL